MKCRQCGTEIAEKALICFRCGTAVTEAVHKPAEITSSKARRPVIVYVVFTVLALLAIVLLMLFR